MNRLIIIALMLISLTTFGQDTLKSSASSGFKQLLIGVNISPDYCYRTLTNNSDFLGWLVALRNNNEVPKIGYTTGINICYNISRLFGIEAGIQYSNKGYEREFSDLTFGDMIDPRYGFVYPTNNLPSFDEVKYIYNHYYLDIPVRAIFSFGKKRIQFVTSIGITTNIFLKATQTTVYYYDGEESKSTTQDQQFNYESLDISPTISVGIDYKISNKFNMRMEPTFRYGLLKIIDAPITAYLWNGGLNFSCYYALK